MSNWTANTYTPVTVDGVLGPQTWKALQYGLGVTPDGIFGAESTKALQTFLGVTVDGAFGSGTAEALQSKLGVTADGNIGPLTAAALQRALNAGSLGGAVATPAPTSTAPAGVPTTPTSGQTSGAIPLSAVQYAHNTQAGNLTQWVNEALAITGLPTAWASDMINIIVPNESSGDANAVNNWDLNAHGPVQADGYPQDCSRGLAQVIPPTFCAFRQVGTSESVYDAVSNLAAAFNYIKENYGDMSNVPGIRSVLAGGSYQGY